MGTILSITTMFAYQKNRYFFAQIGDGLEELGAEELVSLGAKDVKTAYRGISFKADNKALYRITYSTKLCARILAPLITFDCHSNKYLYKTTGNINWSDLFSLQDTFAVFASVANSKISHSRHASLVVKDAIVDQFRDKTGKRPNVDSREPDILLHLRVEKNKATISLDVSGGALHRRGYRQETVEAPMQETLAAAIIQLSGWDGTQKLYDPFCGSGTLLAEALLKYCHIPASFFRSRFGFEKLPDFEARLWKETKKQINGNIIELPKDLISGSDKAKKAISGAKKNINQLPSGNMIEMFNKPFQEIPELKDHLIICNPPYGVRLGQEEEAAMLVKEFGDFLKRRCTGSTAFLYLGKRELLKSVGLKPASKKPLKTGGLDGVLAKYELY